MQRRFNGRQIDKGLLPCQQFRARVDRINGYSASPSHCGGYRLQRLGLHVERNPWPYRPCSAGECLLGVGLGLQVCAAQGFEGVRKRVAAVLKNLHIRRPYRSPGEQRFDPRFKRDAYANYYTHNRNHALVQVAYSAANPLGRTGYSATNWGLTASDDPLVGYSAHEAMSNDNGTISPTAALASMPYVPSQALAAAHTFYTTYGATLWGFNGFKDAFHPGLNWTANDYLAIDQGPIVLMIENHRTGLLWDRFMANPEIAPMLAAGGSWLIRTR